MGEITRSKGRALQPPEANGVWRRRAWQFL